jgi:hypothetical protein
MLTSSLACWRWRRHVPPKHRVTFNGLHGIISQKIRTAVRAANPTFPFFVSSFAIISLLLSFSSYSSIFLLLSHHYLDFLRIILVHAEIILTSFRDGSILGLNLGRDTIPTDGSCDFPRNSQTSIETSPEITLQLLPTKSFPVHCISSFNSLSYWRRRYNVTKKINKSISLLFSSSWIFSSFTFPSWPISVSSIFRLAPKWWQL